MNRSRARLARKPLRPRPPVRFVADEQYCRLTRTRDRRERTVVDATLRGAGSPSGESL